MALELGSAVVEITPRTPNLQAGYGSRNRPHEGVHDPLRLRALYARGAGGGEAVVVSADLLWFGQAAADRIRAAIQTELGLDASRILLAGTHTHSAPVVAGEKLDEDWLASVESRALAAAAVARARLRPARLRACRGTSGIGYNRRERKPDGSITLGKNPDGPIDRELIGVSADGTDGTPIALLLGHGCHAVVLGPGNYQISADWPGDMAVRLEERLGGAAVLFLNGGAGNIDPRIRVQKEFGPVRELGDEFLANYDAAAKRYERLPDDDRVRGLDLTVHLPRKQREIEDGKGRTRPTTLKGVRLGPLCIVGYPGEMFTETGQAVKKGSPHPCTLACSYVDGGDAGYVPVREAWEDGGYEVRVSPYAEGAEEVLRKGLLELTARLAE